MNAQEGFDPSGYAKLSKEFSDLEAVTSEITKLFSKENELNEATELAKSDEKMTLTSPTCPLADIIFDEIKSTINDTGKASNVDVGLVFDPPWNKDMITADGKMQLGLI